MRKILDLMRVDLITMNGGKNNMKTILVLMLIIFGGLGFLFSPIVGLYCPMVMGGFFVPMLFHNELKYHSEKLWGLLPIRRRDLVNARFLFATTLYTALSFIFYFLMLLALNLKSYYILIGEQAEHLDFIAILVQRSGGSLTELGLFNLMYFGAFSFGLIVMTGSLRKHFKDSKTTELSLKKASKKEYVYLLLVLAALLLWVLIVSGFFPLGTAAAVIIQLFAQLVGAANGFLLGAVLVTIALFSAIYKYICTVLEYDEKEL